MANAKSRWHRQSVELEKEGQTIRVMPSSVKAWERHGWTAVDDGSSETVQETTAEHVDTAPELESENEENN